MATVNGMTAEAMSAIRNGGITGASFDSANNLILTKYDGTQLNAGPVRAATTTLSGAVELATSAETQAGTDAVRAVTPAGLASLPGTRVQILSSPPAESALQSSYPTGISMMDVSGWSVGGGFGTVVTNNVSQWRCEQTFYKAVGGTSIPLNFMRHHNAADGGGGWTGWYQLLSNPTLSTASFTQLTAAANYPRGFSRLYFTTSNGGSWDFNGLAGEVFTYSDGASFARQTFVQHAVGSANKPVVWTRTSDWSTGWSGWSVILSDPGVWTSYTPTWTTSSGTALPALGNATVDCRYLKLGRKVDLRFEIVFGSTTNFGTSPGGGDNWLFSLPVAAARVADNLGIVELHGSGNSAICVGRARTNTATTLIMGIISGRVDGAAIANTGDVDSISPWAWASGNSLKAIFTYESAS